MKPINEYSLQECYEQLHLLAMSYYTESDKIRAIADRIHKLTRWIPVEESLPDKDETVLVKGICNRELSEPISEPEVGLVSWGSVDQSHCVDTCYYGVWYTDITEWKRI